MHVLRNIIDDALGEITARATDGSERFVLSHQDLVRKNILIDPETGHITGVLDWEWAGYFMKEMEVLSGCDFLRTPLEKKIFMEAAEIDPHLSTQREQGYQLLSALYRMAGCSEWKKEKISLTARLYRDKEMQRESAQYQLTPSDIFKDSLTKLLSNVCGQTL